MNKFVIRKRSTEPGENSSSESRDGSEVSCPREIENNNLTARKLKQIKQSFQQLWIENWSRLAYNT